MQLESKILFFLVIGIIYYLLNTKENMSNEDVSKLINDIYKADISAIRNLSKLANDLTKQGSLSVKGGLKVDGPLDFLPKGSIIAWNGTTAPKGWAVCDGKTVNNYKTPDLRGRFIRMHGGEGMQGINIKYDKTIAGRSRRDHKTQILKHEFGNYGGTDHMILVVNELPAHNHTVNPSGNHTHRLDSNWKVLNPTSYPRRMDNGRFNSVDLGGNNNIASLKHFRTRFSGTHRHTINNTGRNWGHNNQPPYYVLTWIVKVI